MRLASAEVKRLLAHGRRVSAAVAGVVFMSRTLGREHLVTTASADFAAAANTTAAGVARVALAVPKRQLKRAVDRNRVKRILRETFRQHQVRGAGIDILVTLNAIPKLVAANTVKRQVRKNIEQAAVALFTKLAAGIGGR